MLIENPIKFSRLNKNSNLILSQNFHPDSYLVRYNYVI